MSEKIVRQTTAAGQFAIDLAHHFGLGPYYLIGPWPPAIIQALQCSGIIVQDTNCLAQPRTLPVRWTLIACQWWFSKGMKELNIPPSLAGVGFALLPESESQPNTHYHLSHLAEFMSKFGYIPEYLEARPTHLNQLNLDHFDRFVAFTKPPDNPTGKSEPREGLENTFDRKLSPYYLALQHLSPRGLVLDLTVAHRNPNFLRVNRISNIETASITPALPINHSSLLADAVLALDGIDSIEQLQRCLALTRTRIRPDGRLIFTLRMSENFGVATVEKHLEPEFIFDAGYSLPNGDRLTTTKNPSPLNSSSEDTLGELVLVYFRNPFLCAGKNTSKTYHHPDFPPQKPDAPIPTHLDYARYYTNPWLLRSIVETSVRISNLGSLIRLAQQGLTTSAFSTPDHGACLCVLTYAGLKTGNTNLLRECLERIDRYLELRSKNPHVQRWQISLSYAAGAALQSLSKHDDAIHYLQHCLSLDPFYFNAFLAKKTMGASFTVACHHLQLNQFERAKNLLERAIVQGRTALTMISSAPELLSEKHPLFFDTAEYASILSLIERCSRQLQTLEHTGQKPERLAFVN